MIAIPGLGNYVLCTVPSAPQAYYSADGCCSGEDGAPAQMGPMLLPCYYPMYTEVPDTFGASHIDTSNTACNAEVMSAEQWLEALGLAPLPPKGHEEQVSNQSPLGHQDANSIDGVAPVVRRHMSAKLRRALLLPKAFVSLSSGRRAVPSQGSRETKPATCHPDSWAARLSATASAVTSQRGPRHVTKQALAESEARPTGTKGVEIKEGRTQMEASPSSSPLASSKGDKMEKLQHLANRKPSGEVASRQVLLALPTEQAPGRGAPCSQVQSKKAMPLGQEASAASKKSLEKKTKAESTKGRDAAKRNDKKTGTLLVEKPQLKAEKTQDWKYETQDKEPDLLQESKQESKKEEAVENPAKAQRKEKEYPRELFQENKENHVEDEMKRLIRTVPKEEAIQDGEKEQAAQDTEDLKQKDVDSNISSCDTGEPALHHEVDESSVDLDQVADGRVAEGDLPNGSFLEVRQLLLVHKDLVESGSPPEIATLFAAVDESREAERPIHPAAKTNPRTSSTISKTEKLRRSVQSHLNKVCPENVHIIAKRLLTVEILDASDLELVISLIFHKALSEPHYCETYADLVFTVRDQLPQYEAKDGNQGVTVKSALLNACQAEFESLRQPTKEEATSGMEPLDPEETEFLATKRKKRVLANMKLIGHLFLRRLLSPRVIESVLTRLLQGQSNALLPEDYEIECACELLVAVGFAFESLPSGKHVMTQACSRLLDLRGRKNKEESYVYPKRLQFVMQNVLDVRNSGWEKKVFISSAKTKEDIRQEQMHDHDKNSQANNNVAPGIQSIIAGQRPWYMEK